MRVRAAYAFYFVIFTLIFIMPSHVLAGGGAAGSARGATMNTSNTCGQSCRGPNGQTIQDERCCQVYGFGVRGDAPFPGPPCCSFFGTGQCDYDEQSLFVPVMSPDDPEKPDGCVSRSSNATASPGV